MWSVAAGIVGVGVLAGIGKTWRDARNWHADQMRDKAPWERATQ